MSMRKGAGVTFVLAAVLVGLGVMTVRQLASLPSPRPASAAVREDAPPSAPYTNAPPILAHRQESAPALPSASPPTNNIAGGGAGDEADRSPRTPPDKERQAFATRVFESEAFDKGWGTETAQRLNGALAEVSAPGVRPKGTHCRSTLCKVELDADDLRSADASLKTIVRALKWQGSGMVVRGEPDARGAVAVTLYLSRGSSPLPEPPPESR